ncbi:MAG: dihydrolipoyllysine-residue acetyltransferase [Pseudomonadota bacterium]
MEITIPNLGDVDEVEVIEICVVVGDEVAEEDALLVIESDKASMEIPSPAAGTIAALHVSLGDQVGEGHLVATLEIAASQEAEPAGETAPTEAPVAAAEPALAPAAEPVATTSEVVDILVPDIGDAKDVVVIEVTANAGDTVTESDLLVVLESDKASMEIAAEMVGEIVEVCVAVDDAVEQGTLIARIRTTAVVAEAVASPAAAPAAPAPAEPAKPATAPARTAAPAANAGGSTARVYAGPAVRRLSREMGVDLSAVTGTGNRGRITKEDVKAFVKAQLQNPTTAGGPSGWPLVAEVDFSRFGPVESADLTRIQQRGADNLHRSWVNLPHVTQHNEADITDMEAFRASLKAEAAQREIKLTPLAFIVKACCAALAEFPHFNASLHPDGKSLYVKKYINIGMAVDTPEGLVVPVIRGADQMSVWELSGKIAELAGKARDKKLGMDDLQGGTFSVSSLGSLGGTGFTPIVNAPEVAILGVANMQMKPVWDGAEFQPRKVLPLSLSYDHRVINGADGGRFMNFVVACLSDLRRLAL